MSVFGYRMAMILSGGIALIWAEQWQSWGRVYGSWPASWWRRRGVLAAALPRVSSASKPLPAIRCANCWASWPCWPACWPAPSFRRWVLIGLGLDPDDPTNGSSCCSSWPASPAPCPWAAWAARRVGFETLNQSLTSYFRQPGAWAFLLLIVLYKLSDAFAGSLTTPFLIKGMAFSQAEVGIVNKIIGIWLTIFGAIAAGALMLRLNLYRSLLLFGVLQTAVQLRLLRPGGAGQGRLGRLHPAPFDWGFVAMEPGGRYRRPAHGRHRRREHHQRHGHGGLRRPAHEPVQPALHGHPLCAAVGPGGGRPHLRQPPVRRAGGIGRLAGVLPVLVVLAVPGVYMVWRMRGTIEALMGKEETKT
jgi:hypothetical protein